ncbi:lactonase family protein [Deinococcus alpinitundrae]|uniref:lactonase family protein n=1 Tax=Deinococcus alpinitundrae TaxID=468913 RepID=UPI00137A34C8|nr:lactonase family protein [Deinococcus alpinitundrae]
MTTQRFFVGSYTHPLPHAPQAQGRGVYGLSLDPETGQLSPAQLLAELPQPSFLAAHPSLPVLYAVSEVQQGQLSAARAAPDGTLERLGQQSTQGDSPVHVRVDALGRWALAVNYVSGVSVLAYPLEENGQPGPCAARAQHHGHGPNRQRQGEPHPHSVTPAPDARHAYVADLGTDEVVTYDLAAGSLLTRLGTLHLPPGSGPRHLAFDAAGTLAFLTLELSGSVAAIRRDPPRGSLDLLGVFPARPADAAGRSSPAEVLVSGRFVYLSNRGQDSTPSSLSVFGINPESGVLEPVQHLLLPDRTPRSCAFSPDGAWLLVANQDSSSITVLERDSASGELELRDTFDCPTPTSVCFLP